MSFLGKDGHSPLGGSVAPRLLACLGSPRMAQGVEDPESEHAALGTAAHKLGELCLTTGAEPWEYIGQVLPGTNITCDKDMADAVQVYTGFARSVRNDANQSNRWVERSFRCRSLHPLYYSTADLVDYYELRRHLDVTDYKHGAGVVVEAVDNAQCMYYGAGVLEDLQLWDKVDTITLRIVQPRGFHFEGPIREHTMHVDELHDWLHEVMLPAMRAAEQPDAPLKVGEHCRFCPARRAACPAMMGAMKEFGEMTERINHAGGAGDLTNAEVGRYLDLLTLAKIAGKAANETAFNRLQAGQNVPGYKLGNARSNREWKEEAEAALKKKFGAKAYTEPKLKSPAEVDKLPEGKALTERLAYKPDAGLTVIPEKDPRPAVSRDTKALFKPVKKGK